MAEQKIQRVAPIQLPLSRFTQCPVTHRFLLDRRVRLWGLTDALKENLYPHWSYNSTSASSSSSSSSSSSGRPQGAALQLGNLVHKQIAETVLRGGIPDEKCHPYVKHFFFSCHEMGLEPVACEIVVGSEKHGIATRMDILLRLKANKRVHYGGEVKTGCMPYYHRHSGHNLPVPFEDFKDSPYSQHQAQLTATRWMFENTYPELRLAGGYVIVLHDKKVQWHEQHNTMWKNADVLMDIIAIRTNSKQITERKKPTSSNNSPDVEMKEEARPKTIKKKTKMTKKKTTPATKKKTATKRKTNRTYFSAFG